MTERPEERLGVPAFCFHASVVIAPSIYAMCSKGGSKEEEEKAFPLGRDTWMEIAY